MYQLSAFDALIGTSVGFSYQGNQVFKNRLVIRDNQTNKIVYDNTQTSFQLRHIVSSENIDSLHNGDCYNAEICIYDSNNVSSPFSDKIVFYCFTTPKLVFDNLISDQMVLNSFYKLKINYIQPENEMLNSYQMILYDSQQKEIHKTSEIFDTSELEYTLSGLESNTQYYVQATGVTINQMIVDTGKFAFSVRYKQPTTFGVVNLENVSRSAEIKIISNIKSIIGRAIPDPPIYIDNEKVDLREKDTQVIFDENYNIKDNLWLQMILQDINEQETIFKAVGAEGSSFYIRNKSIKVITLGDELQYYFDVIVTNGLIDYITSSNYISLPSPSDYIFIDLIKINDMYEIKITNLGSERGVIE